MKTNEVLLDVRDLCVTFHSDNIAVRAVDGVSFSLGRGRVLGIVGESGCGKSVVANSLLGLIDDSNSIIDGQIFLHPPGEPALDVLRLAEYGPELRRLRGGLASMIFQEPQSALSPVHTIGDQICEAILVHRRLTRRQAERLAIDMLIEVGIEKPVNRMKQYPHELSGGMRQRVVIAMALICDPLLLIADEPTTSLDVLLQARVFRLMRNMQSKLGTALLIITHDFDAVAQIADEILVMYCGRVVERGTAHEVLNNPRHPYTEALLASRSAYAFREKGKRLPFIPGTVPAVGALPEGCSFHPRCRYARANICDQGVRPPLRPLTPFHEVACAYVEVLCHE